MERNIRPHGRLEINASVSKSLHQQGKHMSTHDVMYGESHLVLTADGHLIAEYSNGYAENAGKADPKNPEHVAAVERAGGFLKPDGKFATERELTAMREAQKQAAVDKHQAGEKAATEKHQEAEKLAVEKHEQVEKAVAEQHRSAEQRAAEGRQLLEKAAQQQQQEQQQPVVVVSNEFEKLRQESRREGIAEDRARRQADPPELVKPAHVSPALRTELRQELRAAENRYYDDLSATTGWSLPEHERLAGQVMAHGAYQEAKERALANFAEKAYGVNRTPRHESEKNMITTDKEHEPENRPRNIGPDWTAKVDGDRTDYHWKTSESPAFSDTQKSVKIHDASPESVRAALLLVKDKGWETFRMNVSEKNRDTYIAEAGKLGMLNQVNGPPAIVERIAAMQKEDWMNSPEYKQAQEVSQARQAAEKAHAQCKPGVDPDKVREAAGMDKDVRAKLAENDKAHHEVEQSHEQQQTGQQREEREEKRVEAHEAAGVDVAPPHVQERTQEQENDYGR